MRDPIGHHRLLRYGERWIAHDIVEGIHLLPAPFSLQIIDDVLEANLTGVIDDSNLLTEYCIEALERIGTPEAIERLCQLVLVSVDDDGSLVPERALRAVESLAPRDREAWVLKLIVDHPVRSVLHRALDTLAVIGTESSLPVLQQFLGQDQPDCIRSFAYWATDAIHRRSGRLWFNDEERPTGAAPVRRVS